MCANVYAFAAQVKADIRNIPFLSNSHTPVFSARCSDIYAIINIMKKDASEDT